MAATEQHFYRFTSAALALRVAGIFVRLLYRKVSSLQWELFPSVLADRERFTNGKEGKL